MDNFSEILTLSEKSTPHFFKKGDIIQQAGDIASQIFYVKKGLLRTYLIDEKGKEHVFMFVPEGWVTADLESQQFDHPAVLFIECLEDSEVIVLNDKAFRNEKLNTEQLERLIYLLNRRIGILQNRIMMLMSASAQKRYKHFLETYPELPQRVPQRMIASYLGITPQALSTIRKEMTSKK